MSYDKIICIDFDGVLHSYSSGWKGVGVIADPPVEGAIQWLQRLIDTEGLKPVIYSSRSKEPMGIFTMQRWLVQWGLSEAEVGKLDFPDQKPAAFLTIDDRAICFTGIFPTTEAIANFKPWNKQ